jgi:glycosyltransferase involved in cell wall biosynthesis
MNILINCSNLKIGGGLQVAHSFVSNLKDFKEHRFVIVASSELTKQIDLNSFPKNIKVIMYNVNAKALKTIIGKDPFLDKIVLDNLIDTVFSVFGPTYWKPKVKHIVGYAKPHYVYTNSPFFKTLSLMSSLKLNIKKFFHMYDFKHNNQVLITENEDVSQRLRDIIKGKEIHTVTNYYNQIFDQEEKWDRSLQLPKFEGFTLLTVSANYPHKNLQIIPKVIAYLIQNDKDFNFRFVVTLKQGELGLNLEEDINRNIVYLGKTNINQCPWLYSQSDAIFLPTLLECFTATYPEAMRMKRPILTSNLNFATGLCEDAAVYFEPLDAKNIGDAIYEMATNSNRRERLIKNGEEQLKKYDTYATRAEKYIEIITK